MDTWMIVVGGLIVALPFLLMVLFNAGDRADSAGRRARHSWQVRRHKI